ncbi:hypothetical protein HK098_004449 [Nowakowskiella sp. JEL0407]|nr:hypothetical protein HK098_004449 [Nowakowskiella sp. JEL0407]
MFSPDCFSHPLCPNSPPPSDFKSPSRYLKKFNLLTPSKNLTPSSIRRSIQLKEQLADFECCIQKSVEMNSEYEKDLAEWRAYQRKKHREAMVAEGLELDGDVEMEGEENCSTLSLPPPCALLTPLQSIGEECDEMDEEEEETREEPKLHRSNSNLSLTTAVGGMTTIDEAEEGEEKEECEDDNMQFESNGISMKSPFGSPDLSYIARGGRSLSWGSISSADTMCISDDEEESKLCVIRPSVQLQPILESEEL